MHEVNYAYIVLTTVQKKEREIPHPLLSLPYSETVQGIWRLSVESEDNIEQFFYNNSSYDSELNTDSVWVQHWLTRT